MRSEELWYRLAAIYFFPFKTCAARFMCAFGTFRLYAQTAYLRTFLHILHDCTIKMAFYISTIYNIYPLYIPIQYIFYMYIYIINRAIVRMPYILRLRAVQIVPETCRKSCQVC